MRSRSTTVPIGLTAAVLLAACGTGAAIPGPDGGPRGDFPLTVSSCGRDVTFDEPPRRVVTVGSVAAPLVAAAGAADRIVVRTFETASFPGEYAPELDGVEVVAPTVELAREEIISRTPDLVISYEGAATGAEDLAGVGIDLLVSRGYCQDAAGDLEDVFADIELYGRLFGTAEAATAEVASLRRRVAAVGERFPPAASARRAAALILSRDGGSLSAYGATSTVDEQMRLLGLANVFGDVPRRSFEANLETLVTQDPQVLILLTQGDQTPEGARRALLQRPELAAITAIRTDAVITVPFGYTGPGPVAVEGLEVLADELRALG